MIPVILLYALLATIFPLGKASLAYVAPIFLTGARMIIGGVILLIAQWFYDKNRFGWSKRLWWQLVVLTVFNIYLTNVLEFWGLQYLPAAKTCFIYNLSPFIAALISYLLFNESLSRTKWMGLLVGIIGFIPILVHHSAAEDMVGGFFIFSWPEIAVLGAACATVYGWIGMRQVRLDGHYGPLMANGLSMLLGGLLSLATSLLFESWNPVPVVVWQPFLLYMFAMILLQNLIAYNIYGVLLKQYTATFLSFAGFMSPFFAALYSWLYLGEIITWHFYLSAVIVFAGLYIFYKEE